MSATFDPNNHLRQLRGKGGTADYLDVKWRLVWLRGDHPDAGIDSALLAGGLVEGYAIFRATVTIPGKGHATAHGSETKADFGDYLEKAETKAIGRALAMLGYGTQFVGYELDEGERIADAPVDRQHAPEAAAPRALSSAGGKVASWPDEQLLSVVQDDRRDPVRRVAAGKIYAERATDPLELHQRMLALGALPREDRAAIREAAAARLAATEWDEE